MASIQKEEDSKKDVLENGQDEELDDVEEDAKKKKKKKKKKKTADTEVAGDNEVSNATENVKSLSVDDATPEGEEKKKKKKNKSKGGKGAAKEQTNPGWIMVVDIPIAKLYPQEIENANARSTSHSPDLFDRNSDLGITNRSPLKELSDIPNKRKAEIIGDQNESQLLVASKIRRGEDGTFGNFGGGTRNNTENERNEDKSNSADRVPDSQSESEDKDRKPKCAKCLFENELDKRNYYFGNLLTGELQFVPPCMRSVAYIEILKYIDSLKQRHRNE